MVVEVARERGLLTVADNTFATPWAQRPLEWGFDLVIHSATKYLNGHSDLIGGIAVCRDAALAERLGYLQNAIGAIASPFVQMSQSFQKQANLLWYEIFDVVKQNCTTAFAGNPQDDIMEALLSGRKGKR